MFVNSLKITFILFVYKYIEPTTSTPIKESSNVTASLALTESPISCAKEPICVEEDTEVNMDCTVSSPSLNER